MEDFKVLFPSGYNVYDYYDDNIDLNIIFPTGLVFFSTFFTVSNIKKLIEEHKTSYFWSTDMLIVKDLKKETIKNVIIEMIDDNYFKSICSYIGHVNEVLPNTPNYYDIISDI